MTMKNFFSDLENTVVKSAEYFIWRQERNGADYPFVDTKFNIRSGKEFDVSCEEFKRRNCIFGWIQGRGIESMAIHSLYFTENGSVKLADRFRLKLKNTVEALEKLRKNNGGRLFFAMKKSGEPFFSAPTPHSNYTDLFYFKGLCAAAKVLEDDILFAQAEKSLTVVAEDILSRRFTSDQFMFDPANRGKAEPGKFSQGPLMILLDGTAVTENLPLAAKLISEILNKHLNSGRFSHLPEWSFVESLDANDEPWVESDNRIICDPGHALEFTGLAAKNLIGMTSDAEYRRFAAEKADILAQLFCRTCDIGLQPASGIIKSYDLKRKEAVNTDAPWWSLPEAIRAAVLLSKLAPQHERELLVRAEIMAERFNKLYIAQGTNGFACQMCDCSGNAIDVIPAVPDADPLYHTNLSLIDVLTCK